MSTWTQAPWRWGKGRDAPQGSICGECVGWVRRSGAYSGHGWREHLLAACCELRKAAVDVHYDLRAFHESGADPAGTPERWEYLGTVRSQLRARLLREHPSLVTPTEHEARVLRLERAIAEVEHPRERTPLARL